MSEQSVVDSMSALASVAAPVRSEVIRFGAL